MEELNSNENGALVLYSPNTLQIAENVQKLLPIGQLVIENRIADADEIYTASISEIKIYPGKVQCSSTISHFIKKPIAVCQEESNVGFLRALRKRVFKPASDNSVALLPTIVVDGIDFILDWQQLLSKNIIIGTDYTEKSLKFDARFIAEIKTELAERRNILLSNRFLMSLFEPIGSALVEVYCDMAQF